MSVVYAERTPGARYPDECPFSPHEDYPDYTLGHVGTERNHAYALVRDCLRAAADQLGADVNNPLEPWIQPEMTVLLKPNMVKEHHPRDPRGWTYVLTHGSVVRAVADHVFLALRGRGRVIVGDAPQTDSSFSRIRCLLGLDALAAFYAEKGLHFEVRDFRKQEWDAKDGVVFRRRELDGDPDGYARFDLGEGSEFAGHRGEGSYYGADYDTREVNDHHRDGRHEYLVSGTAIKADVFFNLPKLKTHKLAGITCSLKNLVGINGDKNWLPHHTTGKPEDGGDAYPSESVRTTTERSLLPALRKAALAIPYAGPAALWALKKAASPIMGSTDKVPRGGNWYGNDTAWRMCLDLNKVLLYGNPDGSLRPDTPESRKTYLSLCDGIVGGQGNGPMNPDPVPAGLVSFGDDPAACDAFCAVVMGFDPECIPIVRQAFQCRRYPITEGRWNEVVCRSSDPDWDVPLGEIDGGRALHFRPHFGWQGHIESRG